ncbi:MAG: iron-sulfur cluster repair di-iron protein [Bacteroidetes bacterium]|nr:MAG: iron-sulfur cluster repair di-iron protein [Bacteroidota bacterium]
MKQFDINTTTVGEIVALDYRAASIFKEAGIDFCCGGGKSIDEACREKAVDSLKLKEKLKKLETAADNSTYNFNEWELGFLCDYIINKHHKFVIRSLPELKQYTLKIATVHGEKHPELNEVADLFSQINTELLQHLKNEEEVLFPAIKEAVKRINPVVKNLIESEILRMSKEHEFVGVAMDKICEITKSYFVPADGCNTYQVTFKLLQQFEDDLHTHIHLENNILYPKSLSIKL